MTRQSVTQRMARKVNSKPPRVSRLRAFLETYRLLDDAVSVLSRHVELLGGAFYYYLGGFKKVLVVTDPDALRRIFKDNYQNYPKSDIQVQYLGRFLGQGLLTSHGEPWRRKRRLIQQAFDAHRLAAMIDGMHDALAEALTKFDMQIQIRAGRRGCRDDTADVLHGNPVDVFDPAHRRRYAIDKWWD